MHSCHLFYLQLLLSEKAVKPQEPGTIGLDGGRGVPGCRFPVQKQLHLTGEVQVGINQILHAPTVGCVSGDHFEGIHHFISNTLFQKNARSCRFFVGRDAPKNMETMTTRSPKRARSFRCFPHILLSRENFCIGPNCAYTRFTPQKLGWVLLEGRYIYPCSHIQLHQTPTWPTSHRRYIDFR